MNRNQINGLAAGDEIEHDGDPGVVMAVVPETRTVVIEWRTTARRWRVDCGQDNRAQMAGRLWSGQPRADGGSIVVRTTARRRRVDCGQDDQHLRDAVLVRKNPAGFSLPAAHGGDCADAGEHPADIWILSLYTGGVSADTRLMRKGFDEGFHRGVVQGERDGFKRGRVVADKIYDLLAQGATIKAREGMKPVFSYSPAVISGLDVRFPGDGAIITNNAQEDGR